MKLDTLTEMWAEDGQIEVADISNEAANIPKLHNKYFRLYSNEGLRLKKMKADYKQLRRLKIEYYKGQLDDDELKQNGWKPQQLKILNSDIPMYLDADQDIIELSLRIGLQEAIVEYLESIIKQINNRGYHLKTISDWERFRTGAL